MRPQVLLNPAGDGPAQEAEPPGERRPPRERSQPARKSMISCGDTKPAASLPAAGIARHEVRENRHRGDRRGHLDEAAHQGEVRRGQSGGHDGRPGPFGHGVLGLAEEGQEDHAERVKPGEKGAGKSCRPEPAGRPAGELQAWFRIRSLL